MHTCSAFWRKMGMTDLILEGENAWLCNNKVSEERDGITKY